MTGLLSARSAGGQTPGMCAIKSANFDLIQFCITNLGLTAFDEDYTGQTAIEQA